MRVFIDANIFLRLLLVWGDTFEPLKKILNLAEKKKIKIFLTKQVQDEYLRNRRKIINEFSDSLKKKTDSLKVLDLNLPKLEGIDKRELANNAKEYNDIIEKIKSETPKYLERLEDSYEKHSTVFDKHLGKIMAVAEVHVETKEQLDRAQSRYLRGNPPGKEGSLGDAISWEIILEKASDDDMLLVTNDNDFIDRTRKGEILLKEILQEEWKKKTGKKIHVVDSLGDAVNILDQKETISKKEIETEKDAVFTVLGSENYPITTSSILGRALVENTPTISTLVAPYANQISLGIHPAILANQQLDEQYKSLLNKINNSFLVSPSTRLGPDKDSKGGGLS